MASLDENINIIETAVYGKEMRPAIADALRQSNGVINVMLDNVNNLNARVDALSGGTTPDPGGGDSGGGTIIDLGDLIPPILVVNGAITELETSGSYAV